jgi:hypothetical protein
MVFFPFFVSFLSAFVVAGAWFRPYAAVLPKPARGCATALQKRYLAKNVHCWHMLVIPSHHASPYVFLVRDTGG